MLCDALLTAMFVLMSWRGGPGRKTSFSGGSGFSVLESVARP